MTYSKIITVCSQTSTKHTNAQCGQNIEFVNVKSWWFVQWPLGIKWT